MFGSRFDDQSVLFIDLGLFSTPIVDWLNDRPREIRAILLTHNDSDHAGGLCSLSKDHGRRIQSIYMLQDRPKKHSQMEKIFRCAYEGEQKGYYKITQAAAGQVIWQNQAQGLILKIVHPSFSQAYLASNPNQHSAMAVLTYHDIIIATWPGDLLLKQVHGELGGAHPWVMNRTTSRGTKGLQGQT
ncbi:MAG: MBL fold metallo-hydrolase [Blastochloris sp.]|nr:MBL fold metallo-hydrolase [Blastochloris sp.]